MATFQEHCADCARELGDGFAQVHEWLDELQPDYGPMHRAFRHHTEGVEAVRAKWGDKAAEAARIHIRRDCGGQIPTPDRLRRYWGVRLEDISPEEADE